MTRRPLHSAIAYRTLASVLWDIRSLCSEIRDRVATSLASSDGLDAREDSRAFGAAIESRVASAWDETCTANDWACEPRPGAREIFDLSAMVDGLRIGVDVKTRNDDPGKYTDGGVCSVDNLLRFLAGRDEQARGMLVLLEVAHRRNSEGRRDISSVTALPIHALPVGALRIENLGTGQLRLNEPLVALALRADWTATPQTFLGPFVELARTHYDRVVADASRRREMLAAFAEGGYRDFVAPRSRR